MRYNVMLGPSSILVEAPFSNSADLLPLGQNVEIDLMISRVLFLSEMIGCARHVTHAPKTTASAGLYLEQDRF